MLIVYVREEFGRNSSSIELIIFPLKCLLFREGYEQASLYGTPELERDNILADQHCVSSLCKLYFR